MNTSTVRDRPGYLVLLLLLLSLSASWLNAEDDLSRQLIKQLEANGWVQEPSTDGSITYRLPRERLTHGSSAPLSHDLQQQLESLGWKSEQLEDGSRIYHQPVAVEMPADAVSAPVHITGRGQLAPANHGLTERLRERHWEMNRLEDGSLVLRPRQTPESKTEPVAENTGHSSSSSEVSDPGDGGIKGSRLSGFEYWRIEHGDDGTVLFHPLDATPQQGEPQPTLITTDYQALHFQSKEIALPVDQWEEVRHLAQLWIDHRDLQELQVGKIRQVLRLYVVSIVAAKPPYTLRHQLVIRSSDGALILIE